MEEEHSRCTDEEAEPTAGAPVLSQAGLLPHLPPFQRPLAPLVADGRLLPRLAKLLLVEAAGEAAADQPLPAGTVAGCFRLLSALASHSQRAAERVAETPGLLQGIKAKFLQPPPASASADDGAAGGWGKCDGVRWEEW